MCSNQVCIRGDRLIRLKTDVFFLYMYIYIYVYIYIYLRKYICMIYIHIVNIWAGTYVYYEWG